jgi:hypothetical protein
MDNRLNLAAPWIVYYHKIEALFKDDPAIKIVFDNENLVLKLYVEGDEKYNALAKLLPFEKDFGNVSLKIQVIPANTLQVSDINLFEKAFEGNPAVSFIKSVIDVSSNNFNFVVFQKKVVQFYDDNLGDINGLHSTLYHDIAKEVFGEREGIYFCTDKE